jgi:type VI secretion system secreted protein Hcp
MATPERAASTPAPPRPATSIDMFVKIKGAVQGVIKGESNDAKHPGEIIVLWYGWDIVQPYDRSGSGMAAGKRELGVFRFLMQTQSATPKLLSAAASGEPLKEVTFTCRKAGQEQQEFMTWLLTDAIITRVDTGYLAPDEIVPHDYVSLSFRTISLTYKEQKPDGTLGGGITFMDDWKI